MGQSGRGLFETCDDCSNDSVYLCCQVGTGPLEHVPHPLQTGDLVLSRVAPRRGHAFLIEGRQGLGDAARSQGYFAVLKKDPPERGAGRLLLKEGVKARQIGDWPAQGEAFSSCLSPSPQRLEDLIRSFPFFAPTHLHVEAPLLPSACRGIPDLRLVPEDRSRSCPVSDRLDVPHVDAPVISPTEIGRASCRERVEI